MNVHQLLGITNNADVPKHLSVDLGKLGADGLKAMMTFAPFALTEGPGATYYRSREAGQECTALRVHTSKVGDVTLRWAVIRHSETGIAQREENVTLPVLLRRGDLLELAVHDNVPLPGYWSNLGGAWPPLRVFGCVVITDRLTPYMGGRS